MKNLNSVLIEGNLTRDGEISTIANGSQLGKFSIASNYSYKKNDVWVDEPSYIDIVAWRDTADVVHALKKGQKVKVIGRLKQDRWTSTDGKAMSKIVIVAEDIEVIQRESKPASVPEDTNNVSEKTNSGRTLASRDEEFEDDVPF